MHVSHVTHTNAETQRFAVPSPPLRLPAAHGHLDAAGHLPASLLQGHHHSPHVFPGLPRTNSPAPKALSDRALCAPQRPLLCWDLLCGLTSPSLPGPQALVGHFKQDHCMDRPRSCSPLTTSPQDHLLVPSPLPPLPLQGPGRDAVCRDRGIKTERGDRAQEGASFTRTPAAQPRRPAQHAITSSASQDRPEPSFMEKLIIWAF